MNSEFEAGQIYDLRVMEIEFIKRCFAWQWLGSDKRLAAQLDLLIHSTRSETRSARYRLRSSSLRPRLSIGS